MFYSAFIKCIKSFVLLGLGLGIKYYPHCKIQGKFFAMTISGGPQRSDHSCLMMINIALVSQSSGFLLEGVQLEEIV